MSWGTLQTGKVIDWRRDYQNNRNSPPNYFRLIPYLNFNRVGDHKVIWDLNRHQHLVLLAQASLLTSRQDFLTEIEEQVESWLVANPFMRDRDLAATLRAGGDAPIHTTVIV